LGEETAAFYLKFFFTNFVKLYSHNYQNQLSDVKQSLLQKRKSRTGRVVPLQPKDDPQ